MITVRHCWYKGFESINPDNLPKLFKKSSSKSFQCKGLGLNMPKIVVEAHGSEILTRQLK